MSLLTADYDYPLPQSLIASHPPAQREDARMLVLFKKEGRWEHRSFRDFPQYLHRGDLVVLNDTRVIRARLFSDDGRIELLLLEQLGSALWRCMVKPGRKMRLGATVVVGGISGCVREVFADGDRLVEFEKSLDLQKVGQLPLPPYMERVAQEVDLERYQTVYSREEGSVAAPTAGLHFTSALLAQIPHAFVTLHVGAGTFRPVQVDSLTEHPMHTERYVLSEETALQIIQATRIVAVGTTTTRVLESCAREQRPLVPGAGRTNIFIHPPYSFLAVGAMLTNFHLPKSTLLMLVSAFAGRELVMAAYGDAIREQYRFFSYGDCMLIV